MILGARKYTVLSNERETLTTATLALAASDGTVPSFRGGQCLTVYFPDLSATLGKQYSISSAPCERALAITVKAIGRFSNRLCSLKRGDFLLASPPHGDFYPHTQRPAVFLAGGMGVTPFRGTIVQAARDGSRQRMTLLYSSKFAAEMPFGEELHEISKRSIPLTVMRFLTKERDTGLEAKHRRMRTDDILTAATEPSEFLISGSISFVLEQKNALVASGISRADIRTEAYF